MRSPDEFSRQRRKYWSYRSNRTYFFCVSYSLVVCAGCNTPPRFDQLRLEGQKQVANHNIGAARGLFSQAQELRPENAYNLHDLGVCAMYFARDKFRQRNAMAAMREVDEAINNYSRAINAHPGFQAALLGKNLALELKGQFEEALKAADWARQFVGPSAKQQIFLAHELEERGDMDGAQLRYRQAVAMEEDSAYAQAEMGKFLHRQQRVDEAIGHLQKAYKLNPREPGVAELLARLGALP